MYKKRLLSILTCFTILAMLFAGNVTSTTALSIEGMVKNQTTYENLNLIILVKASMLSSEPINDFESNPKSKLQVIQDSVKSVFEIYQFPTNVNIGLMAYGHKFVRDFNFSCSESNVEEMLPLQAFSPNIDLTSFTSISGLGDAPTSIALTEAAKKFPQNSPNALNVILLIADGTDSCGQDPVEAAKLLAANQKVIIYTIGLSINNNTSAQLSAIAESTGGKYTYISNSLSASERATTELTGLIIKNLDEILSGISVPVPVSTIIEPTTEPQLISTNTAEVIPTATSQIPAATIKPTSIPPVETADTTGNWLTGGILVVAILGLVFLVVLGFLFWKSRLRDVSGQLVDENIETKKTTIDDQKTGQSIAKAERADILNIDLDVFLQDVYENYLTIGQSGKYIVLESLKQKSSDKYQGQFDQLLILARQKYPSKIWIDKNADSQTIVKIVP